MSKSGFKSSLRSCCALFVCRHSIHTVLCVAGTCRHLWDLGLLLSAQPLNLWYSSLNVHLSSERHSIYSDGSKQKYSRQCVTNSTSLLQTNMLFSRWLPERALCFEHTEDECISNQAQGVSWKSVSILLYTCSSRHLRAMQGSSREQIRWLCSDLALAYVLGD